jgi:hypothetical protein
MSDLVVVFLGIIALSSLVQAGFLIGLARGGLKLSRQVGEMQQRYERELRPLLENTARISRNLAEASDLAVLQVRRVDDAVATTLDKLDRTTTHISSLLTRPVGPLANAAALFRGIEKAFDVYRSLSAHDREPRATRTARRAVEEDEHLFI